MEPRWTVDHAHAYDEQMGFGPGRDSLPKSFGARITFTQSGARAEISGQFDGQRIVVTQLGLYCDSVTPRLLSNLTLASVVHDIGERLLQHGVFGPITARPRPTSSEIRELRMVATLYWREYATWGNPTRAVAQAWSAPKPTANRWLQQAHQLYPLPGR